MAYCWCGKSAAQRTVWTDANCGHRFYGCSNFKYEFFSWIDSSLFYRTRSIMPELIRKINIFEEQYKVLEEKLRKKGSCNGVLLKFITIRIVILLYLFLKKKCENEI